jgi:xanthine dehydrogenase accessory factor
MLAIWRAALEEFAEAQDFVIATILSVLGSSPRHVGTRFLIRRSGDIVGTIGGGLFEAEVQQFAAACLQERISRRALFSFTGKDAEALEMICGGEVEVLVEFVDGKDPKGAEVYEILEAMTRQRTTGYAFTSLEMPLAGSTTEPVKHLVVDSNGRRAGSFLGEAEAMKAMPESRLLKPAQLLDVPGNAHPVFLEWLHPTGTAYIFGSGHVGVCVAHLAAYVDFKVVVIDDRSDFASPERVPEADQVVVLDSFAKATADLPIDEDSYIVIVTRGHAHDKTVLAQALKTRAGYIGMIGSRRKTHLIFEALLAEGYTPEEIQRVHAPIGLPIGGETPQEIGVSIIAQMLQARNQGQTSRGQTIPGGSRCCPEG